MPHSLKALQDESGVKMNLVDDPLQFADDITEGKWDNVLKQSDVFCEERRAQIHELIYLEMLADKEIGVARNLLRQPQLPLHAYLTEADPKKYMQLENLLNDVCTRNIEDENSEIFQGIDKMQRRNILKKSICF